MLIPAAPIDIRPGVPGYGGAAQAGQCAMFRGFSHRGQLQVSKNFPTTSYKGAMEFIALPPEVISALIHSGPGRDHC